ncbi:MAG: sigma-70 family RNA polymerase sigma factor, partial [Planctomycetes bacterium]|nr:sigma-70 family RNA polymerase sigma factor [Planctomycetota bacterium]
MEVNELRLALLGKDRSAWNRVYDRYYRIILSVFGDQELAHDTMAETFKSIERFNPEFKLTKWIFGIAKNLRREKARFIRKKGVNYENFSRDNSPIEHIFVDKKARTPLSTAVERETIEKFERILSSLKDQHKQPFMMYYKDKIPTGEIAQKMGIREKDVLNRIDYARRLLRDKLSAHYTEKIKRILPKMDKRLSLRGLIERYVVKEYRGACHDSFVERMSVKEIIQKYS